MRLVTHWRDEDGIPLPAVCWRPGPGYRMISSGVLGGGLGPRQWVLNAQVAAGYARTDPVRHLAELAGRFGLTGPGIGMLTAAQVTGLVTRSDEGAEAAITAGLRVPTWAAAPAAPAAPDGPAAPAAPAALAAPDGPAAPAAPAALAAPDGPAVRADPGLAPGTINIIVSVPVPLTDAALVNAVITVTEAKTQAVLDAGFAATGTATDAVCVAAQDPAGTAAEDFAGPRSAWGARIARSVYAAVLAGATAYRASETPMEGN